MTRENFGNLRRENDGSAVQLSNPANEEYEVSDVCVCVYVCVCVSVNVSVCVPLFTSTQRTLMGGLPVLDQAS